MNGQKDKGKLVTFRLQHVGQLWKTTFRQNSHWNQRKNFAWVKWSFNCTFDYCASKNAQHNEPLQAAVPFCKPTCGSAQPNWRAYAMVKLHFCWFPQLLAHLCTTSTYRRMTKCHKIWGRWEGGRVHPALVILCAWPHPGIIFSYCLPLIKWICGLPRAFFFFGLRCMNSVTADS